MLGDQSTSAFCKYSIDPHVCTIKKKRCNLQNQNLKEANPKHKNQSVLDRFQSSHGSKHPRWRQAAAHVTRTIVRSVFV